MITVDVVVKTFPQDYDWTKYLFCSLSRVTGYRNLILLIENSFPAPGGMPPGTIVARTPDYAPGMPSGIGAAYERLGCWRHSDADRLLFVDSDCVFSRDVDLQTDPTINLGRPIVLYRSWEESGDGVCWKPRAELALGYPAKVETMCRYPFCFPRSVIQECWETLGIERMKGVELTDWNVLGNFAIDYCADQVTPTRYPNVGPSCVRQFWSHDRPTNPEVQAELGRLGLL
jgi:hypothetical protein